ncbi:MAG: hypothetical protein ABEJ02_00205 [Candidatus Paceibacteria bacterium]
MDGFEVKELREELKEYLETRDLSDKWNKAKKFLEQHPQIGSLDFKKIEPKENNIYSFRLDRQYRGLCYFKDGKLIVFSFTNHYD